MKRQLIAAIALGAAALVSHNAYAAQANGSFNGVLGVDSVTGSPLNAATSLNFSSTTSLISGVPANFLGSPNDFVGDLAVAQTFVNPASLNIAAFAPVDNFLTFSSGTTPANRYEFDAASLVVVPSGAQFLTLVLSGTFTDTGGTYDSSSAQVLLSFQDIGGSVSGSLSFGTQPFVDVPAPGALALMGLGLIGMRLVRRKAA